jgi:hypothetical protein
MPKAPRVALTAAVVLIIGMVMLPAASAQEPAGPGTPAQKRACRPDVYRLCAGEIPNVRAITTCLKRKMASLSPDCRAVFAGELR